MARNAPLALSTLFGTGLLLAATLLTLGARDRPPSARPAPAAMPEMTDASMKAWIERYYAAHPARGAQPAAAAAVVADTFLVTNFRFDTDGKTATQVDTARIFEGQAVMWKFVAGFHTTTSGNPTDVPAGLLWDQPIDSAHLTFTYTFATRGTYPFFCAPHGSLFNMVGVVVVTANPLAVPPTAGDGGRAGFVAAPWPNPTRGGASFRFAVPHAGAVRLAVFDVAGREVARVVDETLAAGVYVGAWDGRTAAGGAAAPGEYFARLTGPGTDSRARIVVAR